MRKQLRLSGSGGQGGNVTLHPMCAPNRCEDSKVVTASKRNAAHC